MKGRTSKGGGIADQKEGSELKSILGGETGDEFMPNFISEVVHVKSGEEGVADQEAQKKVSKHITSLLQYRLATHLASERLYLVWQRCSCTLVGGALTLLR